VIFASKHQCSNITTLTLLVGQQAENLTRENLSYEGAKQKLKVETVNKLSIEWNKKSVACI